MGVLQNGSFAGLDRGQTAAGGGSDVTARSISAHTRHHVLGLDSKRGGDAVRLIRSLLPLAAASVLGCASPAGGDSDYGPKPTDPGRIMQDYLRAQLKDPFSAQVEMRAVGRITTRSSLLTPTTYAWGICADVNAKNSFGGYTGFKPVVVIWRSGVGIVEAYGSNSAIDETVARAACRHVGG